MAFTEITVIIISFLLQGEGEDLGIDIKEDGQLFTIIEIPESPQAMVRHCFLVCNSLLHLEFYHYTEQ